MTECRKKQEPKLVLDMDFTEALERFAQTRPAEVDESVERAKQKKPPGDESPGRPDRGLKVRGGAPAGRSRKPD
jgi:hypothetical protein